MNKPMEIAYRVPFEVSSTGREVHLEILMSHTWWLVRDIDLDTADSLSRVLTMLTGYSLAEIELTHLPNNNGVFIAVDDKTFGLGMCVLNQTQADALSDKIVRARKNAIAWQAKRKRINKFFVDRGFGAAYSEFESEAPLPA